MKILIVSAYFPPHNAIGSIRVGNIASELRSLGNDIRVIAAEHADLETSLLYPVEERCVTHLEWTDPLVLARDLLKFKKSDGVVRISQSQNLYGLLKSLLLWPDRHMFWVSPAYNFGCALIKSWKPDIIIASSSPHSSLLVASKLSSKFKIPWVADLRDLMVDNHYNNIPRWRRYFDTKQEKRLLTSASAVISVSQPLVDIIRGKYAVRAETILTGVRNETSLKPLGDINNEKLSIIHAGTIYPKKRDPEPLFKALLLLKNEKHKVKVTFIGKVGSEIDYLINAYDLAEVVEVIPHVPHYQSIEYQAKSDVLLLLLWDVPQEVGVYTGKLFEYLGMRRPILSVGCLNGVAAELITSRGIGAALNSPIEIAEQLKHWIDEKRISGKIDSVPSIKLDGLYAFQQIKYLNKLLFEIRAQKKVKRKIIYFINALEVGGAERHLARLAPLMSKNFDVSIFLFRPAVAHVNSFTDGSVKLLIPKKMKFSLANELQNLVRLIKVMLQNKDAIFHFFLPESYLRAGLIGIVLGHRRMVMSRRSLNNYQQRHRILSKAERLFHRRMVKVLGNSMAVIEQLRAEGVEESKLSLIYNGVEALSNQPFSKASPKLVEKLGKTSGKVVMLCIANFFEYKGHLDLIRACSMVQSQVKNDWVLMLVGRDGGCKSNILREIRNLDLEDNIWIFEEQAELDPFYEIADIGILTSHQEGFSNSVLEKMSAGLPMIVTDVGGNPEAVIDHLNGFVVEPHKPCQIAAAASSLIDNPKLRKEYGLLSFERFSEFYTLQTCASRYEKLYDRID